MSSSAWGRLVGRLIGNLAQGASENDRGDREPMEVVSLANDAKLLLGR